MHDLRLAVGAQHADILQLIVRPGTRLVAMGPGLGLAGSWIVAHVLRTHPYETGATALSSYAVPTALLARVALGTCLLPTQRAAKVDPLTALRAD